MNKAIKIILAVAIALLYPIVIFLLTMVVFPDYKGTDAEYPKDPDYEECRTSGTTRSSSSGVSRPVYEQSCSDRLRKDYEQDIKKFNEDKQLGKDKAGIVASNRIKAVLVFVIIGFAIALAVRGVSAVAAGLVGGSTVLLMFAAGFSVSRSGYIDLVTEVLFLATFIFLVFLLIVTDRVFPELPPLPASLPEPTVEKTNNSQPSKPAKNK